MRSLSVVLVLAAFAFAEETRPNVLFIFSDDHAYQAIGAYGSVINKTPQIDRLAKGGMRFQHCFVTNSICGPCRATILTGKYSHKNGFLRNGNNFDGSQTTFPKLLRAAGYQTAIVGKWHLRSAPTGFDHSHVLIGQGPYYNPPMIRNGERVEHTGYTTEIITELTLDWLKNGRDPKKPFFLMCQHKAPHRNWQPGPKQLQLFDDREIPEPPTLFDDYSGRGTAAREQAMTIARHLTPNDLKLRPPRNLTPEQLAAWNAAYEPKNEAFRRDDPQGDARTRWMYQRYLKDYLRCIAAVDDGVGRLLDYLDQSGLAKNTIVIYTSDQGFYLGEHGWYDKRWMYEESLRTPFLVRWPGVTKPGSVNGDIVLNLDFAQTFLEIAGIARAPREMQGRSLAPLLEGKTPENWRRSMYYHYYEYPGPHAVRKHYGVRTRTLKLIRFYGIDEWELYDLEKDPHELKSVHDDPAYAGVRKQLEEMLKLLQKQYGDTDPEGHQRFKKTPLKEVFKIAGRAFEGRGALRPKMKPDPSMKPFTVGAWCKPAAKDGVIVAQGGETFGYALYLKDGAPYFAVRSAGKLVSVVGPVPESGRWTHIAGVLDTERQLRLYVGGKEVARVKGVAITSTPADGLSIGGDTGSRVGEYEDASFWRGALEDVRLYWGVLGAEAFAAWATR